MTRLSIHEVKLQKNYYRNNFRRSVMVLVTSIGITIFLVLGIFYKVVFKPEPVYYATNNAGFITPLKGMAGPNKSSKALLKPDPPEEMSIKRLDLPSA